MGHVLSLFKRAYQHDGDAEIRDVQKLRAILKPYEPNARMRMLKYVREILQAEENNYEFED